ncbi:hypothetical protein PAXRUDRAFT_170114 [Paxillus rubicundulus Ve08.2h10]|uniref:Uncharacterized protein n=1 Tax=Paxillus rubicundulus Ve08.2h10 TaxID=930991 RepID=A0A0D0DEU9_9AGAM|nr:hypothetical protein PAXRUDRAFT_170800 [Paxillus rubicundulus Ve08.2h10]KIK76394.1 hypothetical protein PAXRUDRAFT_170114 [Paxillus rubicundulus Ve08.2h10]
MHTHKGISTQRNDGGEESQEGLHGASPIGFYTLTLCPDLQGLDLLQVLSVNGCQWRKRRNTITAAAALAAVMWTWHRHYDDAGADFLASCDRKFSELHLGVRGPRSFIPEAIV